MILKNLKLRLLLKQPQLFNAQTIRYYVEINGNPLNQIAVYLVEVTGLEPAASWSQTKHSTKLSYTSLLTIYTVKFLTTVR